MEQDRTNERNAPTTDVATRLRDLGQRIAPTEISDVWVFPPLSHLEGSTEFLLFTRFLPDEMRHLCGAEFAEGNGNGNGSGRVEVVSSDATGSGMVPGNGNGTAPRNGNCRRITEYGAVPSHRVPRVVAGFRERLGDHREPLHFEIGGCTDSWVQLINAGEHPAD